MKRNHQRFRFGVLFAVVVIAMGALAICPAMLPASRALSAMNAQERGGRTKTTPTPNPKPATPRQSPAKPRAGTIVRNQIGMELVYVPPGSFMMGSNNDLSDEKPMHNVTISQPFYMSKYEVTQGQWQAVMGNNPSDKKGCGHTFFDPLTSFAGKSSNCPVEQVSWDDAQSFINKLNESNDGFRYRLPTEAEWEYACRAGTTGDYAGDLDSMAWYSANSGSKTHPVGAKQPNGFGLYDMHGNVWEWCQDWHHPSYDGAPSDGSAWLSGGEQKYRVLRGGSWNDFADSSGSAGRSYDTPDIRDFSLGFRVVAVR